MVTSTFAMHHIPAAVQAPAIAEMLRVLRPGGRLLLADLRPTGRLVAAVIRGLARIASRDGADPFDRLDLRGHAPALRRAGFVDLAFGVERPWTGVLTATRPGRPRAGHPTNPII